MEGVPCRLRAAAAVYRVARTYYANPTSSLVPESTGMMKNIGNRTNTGRKNVDIESTRYPVQSINISAISLDTYPFFFSLPLFPLSLYLRLSWYFRFRTRFRTWTYFNSDP